MLFQRIRKSIEFANVRRKRAECVREGLTQEQVDFAYQLAAEAIAIGEFFGVEQLQSSLQEKVAGRYSLDPATIYLLVQLVILIWKAYQWAKENGLLSDGNPFGNSSGIRELIEGK
jgi:hypothetical protein